MPNRKKTYSLAALFIIIGIIVGLGISSSLDLHLKGNALEAQGTISQESIDVLSRTNEAMAEVVAAVKPSVVNISSKTTVKLRGFGAPFLDDPFFRRFFGDEFELFNRPREYERSGLGSGVIVDGDGYILTNNHVIRGADEIKVKLSDQREFSGKVVGTDPKTDLAVIKIDSNNLPVIKLGDSDKLRVGETVIAIGNPYGLSQTVTSGIVSATGRANVGIADYEDFIQTDAPINPGNSGGALVNIRGELVGINTAIFSTSGGYQGIGFAIPTSMARTVMNSLIEKGKVTRGWLGVYIQPLTPELAKHFGLEDDRGVLVGDVVQDSPAEKAGIRRGDVIVRYDGKEVDDATHLRNLVANTLPGSDVTIELLSDGRPRTVTVKITELPSGMQKFSGSSDNVLKGVYVRNISPAMRERLDIPRHVSGVVVTDVEPGSPSHGILGRDDVILEVNRREIRNTGDYERAVSGLKPDDSVLLLVYRNGSTVYITISGR